MHGLLCQCVCSRVAKFIFRPKYFGYISLPRKTQLISNHIHCASSTPFCAQFSQERFVLRAPADRHRPLYFRLPISQLSSSTILDSFSLEEPRVQLYLEHLLEDYLNVQAKLIHGKLKSEEEGHALHTSIAKLKPIVTLLQEYIRKKQEVEEIKQLAQEFMDSDEDDKDIKQEAENDIKQIKEDMKVLERDILLKLVPPETADHNDIIMEVTAGVGGNEAFLFCKELVDMYTNYALYKGWHVTVLDLDLYDSGHGGLRKASLSISGGEVFKMLKYEGGVHRVQRVPKTESRGRIHTSTVTVAMMPQPTEIDIKINPKDLKIDTFRSSGAGGQHVNTTDSAVRIKHIPSGVVAECQTDRSQIKNRATAMKVLMSRLYEKELESQIVEQKRTRKLQTGTAGRSEKIRTYNFKQDRITDHRVSENMFNIENFLSGGEVLDDMIESLSFEAWKERLLEIITDFHVSKVKQKS